MRSEILIALIVANDVYKDFGYDMVVTSINDSSHGRKSLHYPGLAVDLRTKHVRTDNEKEQITKMIRSYLTTDYDVVLEQLGKKHEHIHIEFDIKR